MSFCLLFFSVGDNWFMWVKSLLLESLWRGWEPLQSASLFINEVAFTVSSLLHWNVFYLFLHCVSRGLNVLSHKVWTALRLLSGGKNSHRPKIRSVVWSLAPPKRPWATHWTSIRAPGGLGIAGPPSVCECLNEWVERKQCKSPLIGKKGKKNSYNTRGCIVSW